MKKRKITVKLDDRNLVVEKLPIGRYSELLKAIQELPKHLQQFEGMTNEKLIAILPQLLGDSLPDVIRIVAIATPLEESEVEQLGLDELTRVLVAIFEVNNYQEVFETIKKVMAQNQKPTKK